MMRISRMANKQFAMFVDGNGFVMEWQGGKVNKNRQFENLLIQVM